MLGNVAGRADGNKRLGNRLRAVPQLAIAVIAGWITTGSAAANDAVRIAAPQALIETGLFAHLAPRFRFKTRLTLEVVPLSAARPEALATGKVHLAIACDGALGDDWREAAGNSAVARPAFTWEATGQGICVTIARKTPRKAPSARLATWLIDGAGQRAVLKFSPGGARLFAKADPAAKVVVTKSPTLDTALLAKGETLSLRHCGRCHVVSKKNRFGGIGSTPSFRALRTIPGGDDKFAAFWSYAPHIAFTQITGITAPFDPARPPPIVPLELTLDDVAAITAFARSLPPADLGAPIKMQ